MASETEVCSLPTKSTRACVFCFVLFPSINCRTLSPVNRLAASLFLETKSSLKVLRSRLDDGRWGFSLLDNIDETFSSMGSEAIETAC